MLTLKAGVKTAGIQPEIVWAAFVADQVYTELGYDCIVTSVVDGKHGRGSLHYVGFALDLRTRHFLEKDKDMDEIAARMIRDRLGKQYDVVAELDHIHVEFQPK